MSRLFLVFAIVSLCAATVAVAQPMGAGQTSSRNGGVRWLQPSHAGL
jgi:hypothetical protein